MLIYVISSRTKKFRKHAIIEGLEFSEGREDPICWRDFCCCWHRFIIVEVDTLILLTLRVKRWIENENVDVGKFILLMLKENRWIENENVEVDKFILLTLRENHWI